MRLYIVHLNGNAMDKQTFVAKIKGLQTVYGTRGGEYRILSVSEDKITGLRPLPAQSPFEIRMDRLYTAYMDLRKQGLPLTTINLKLYVDRVQSPSLAILKGIGVK